MKPDQMVFVGVIDPIDPRVETPEEVRDRVLEAADYIPIEQLGTCDDCGFSPFCDDTTTTRETAFAKIRARVVGTQLAREADRGTIVSPHMRRGRSASRHGAAERSEHSRRATARRRGIAPAVGLAADHAGQHRRCGHHDGRRGPGDVHERGGRGADRMAQADARGAVAARRLPDRSRGDSPRRVENPVLRALQAGEIVRLANHTILISRQRTRTADRRQCGADPGRLGNDRRCGARLSGRVRTTERPSGRARTWRPSSTPLTTPSSARRWKASSDPGTPGPSGCSAIRRSEAIGRPITFLIPPDRQDEEHEILARIARGERVEHFETVRVTKDGRRVDISLTVSPIRDASGQIIGASKIARDITDRKRAEEVLQEADRQKDQFIALLAHELRNPLAPLRNGLQVMRLADGDPATVARARGMMERQLGHMVRLIDDLLDISRISQNKMELRRARDAARGRRQQRGGNGPPAHRRRRTRAHDFASGHAGLPRRRPDAAVAGLQQPAHEQRQVHRARRPILARRGTERRRGGDLGAGHGHRHPGRRAATSIFDMFSQVDRSLERAKDGLGIGLALVKGLVEMHGGTVDGRQARGSEPAVRLPSLFPRCPVDVHRQRPCASISTACPLRQRILVVDDNRDAADSMASMLELMGQEVQTVIRRRRSRRRRGVLSARQ